MLAILLQSVKLQERTLNFLLQFFLLTFIFIACADSLFAAVPMWMLVAQGVHYGLIALTDIYEDDFPESKKKNWTYLSLVIFFVWAIAAGFYENEFIRLHTFIVLMGNLMGGKIDTKSWKIVFAVYMGTIVGYELMSFELLSGGSTLLLYLMATTAVICTCERLSELNQKAWMLHSFMFFAWALFQGAYFQEGVIFIVGGLGYEFIKVTFGFAAETKNETTKRLLFS